MIKVISLGLGVQSTALYFMSSLGKIDRADYAIFADTGGEKSETLEYLEYLRKWKEENDGIELIVRNEKNLERDLLLGENSTGHRMASIPSYTDSGGSVGMLRRQCTSEYKIREIDKAIRQIYGITGKKRLPQTEIWNGISLDEASRMTVPIGKWKIMVYPFCGYSVYPDGKALKNDYPVMRRAEIYTWFEENGFPTPEKSSCVFCPFQSDAAWLRLKTRRPDDFARAVIVDAAIRNSTKNGVEQPAYLHQSLKPIGEVSFDETQLTMWGDCMGFCHV